MFVILFLSLVATVLGFLVTDDGFSKWEKEAIATATNTKDGDENAYQIHLYCGHIFNDHKLRKEAIEQYEKAIVIDGKRPAAYVSLASTHEIIGDYARAIEDWEKAKQMGELTVNNVDIDTYIKDLKARTQDSKK